MPDGHFDQLRAIGDQQPPQGHPAPRQAPGSGEVLSWRKPDCTFEAVALIALFVIG